MADPSRACSQSLPGSNAASANNASGSSYGKRDNVRLLSKFLRAPSPADASSVTLPNWVDERLAASPR